MPNRKAVSKANTQKRVSSKLTSKVREGATQMKNRIGAHTSSGKSATGGTAKTSSIRAKSAISRTATGTASSKSAAKSVKKPAGARSVSTIHLIGKRAEGARTPAVR